MKSQRVQCDSDRDYDYVQNNDWFGLNESNAHSCEV